MILEKKQKVRIKFINEILKLKNKNEKEQSFTNNSLYNIMLLTIILKCFLKENITLKKNNDIQQNSMKYSIELLNYKYSDITNLKLIIFYLGHLFIVLFNGWDDIFNYCQIENIYIKKIEMIMKDNNKDNDDIIISKNEIYPFLKINLISLGYLFTKEKIVFSLNKEIQIELLNYYIQILCDLYPYIISNYILIRKEVLNLIHFENSKNTFHVSQTDFSTIILNLEKQKTLYDDYQRIIDSFYNFFIYSITDISFGRKLFDIINKNFNDYIKDKDDFNKFTEILFIHIYIKCIEKNLSKFFIMSLIIYIHNKILEDIKINSIFYYHIIINFFQLIIHDDVLSEKCTKLFAQIFIKEINEINYENSLVIYLNNILSKKNLKKKIIVPLITYISFYFYEQNINDKMEIYKRCILILEKYSKYDLLKIEVFKEKIEYERLKIIIINFNIYNNPKSELNTTNQALIINYFDFFIILIYFAESNFENLEITTNHSFKNKLLTDIISYIFQLKIYAIDSIEYLTQIMHFVKILLYYFNFKCIINIQDSYTIYKYLSQKYKFLLKQENNKKNLSYLPFLSYYITIFLLIRLNQLFKFQNFFIKINNDILNEINNIDNEYYKRFKQIPFENLLTIDKIENSLRIFYQDLKTNFNYFYEYEINQNIFQRIIDIIYTHIFGYSSILNSFFDEQKKLGYNEKVFETGNYSNYNSEIITEGNENIYHNYIKEDSISMKFTNESMIKENTIENITNEHLIKIPLKNSLKILNEKSLRDVIQIEEENIKL